MSYEKEFRIFSDNVNQAARSLYYHLEIQNQVYEDGIKHANMPNGYFQYSKIYQAIERNPWFWNDHKHSSIVYSVIVLGRIFDVRKDSHGLKKLLAEAKKSNLFNKKALKERRISSSSNGVEWIDDFMAHVHEMNDVDFKAIEEYSQSIRQKWENIKELRNKIYAHQGIMSEKDKTQIFNQSKYSTFEEIISELLTVENIFFDAFHNGRKPDFSFKNLSIRKTINDEVKSLLDKISR